MSFGGTPVYAPVGGSPTPAGGTNIALITGGTLDANLGAFATGNADCARLTSQLPAPVGDFQIPTTFGPGAGQWTQEDVDAMTVLVDDYQAGGSSAISDPRVIGIALTGPAPADVTIDIQNESFYNDGLALVVRLIHEHTAVR